MSSALKSFALAGAFAIAGCAQSGFGRAPGELGPAGASMLPAPQIYVLEGYPDAAQPQVGVINIGNTLYSSTQNGGADNIGASYSVTSGGFEKVMHSFTGEVPTARTQWVR